MEAFLGSLPGHPVPNLRRPPIHTLHLADLLPLSSVWAGRPENPSSLFPPHSPPLMWAATAGTTPYRFNLHVADVGHTLAFGPTGSGKSAFLCTVALQWLRYPGARIWAFDVGLSMWATCSAVGGRHVEIAGEDGGGLAFCPLAELDSDEDLLWAGEWIETCFQMQAGQPATPEQREAITRALQLLRDQGSPQEGRSLTDFRSSVQDVEVRQALDHYTLTGALGGLLDARRESTSDALVNVFEIGRLMKLGERNALPVLLHLFRRIEKALTGAPTLLILDEAWVMLGHPVFRAKVEEWLLQMRKKNCAVLMATQMLSHAARSGLLDVLQESCPTKIFLPNNEAANSGTDAQPGPREFYTLFGLNGAQIEIIRTAEKKRHYYVVSPEGRRLIDFGLGPVVLAFAGVSDPEAVAEVRKFAARHGDEWPKAWLKLKGIDHETLE